MTGLDLIYLQKVIDWRSRQKPKFYHHRRQLLQNRYVYAVVSRRAKGLSIGINLNVDKICNFDCPYCQVDRTVPLTDVQKLVKKRGGCIACTV